MLHTPYDTTFQLAWCHFGLNNNIWCDSDCFLRGARMTSNLYRLHCIVYKVRQLPDVASCPSLRFALPLYKSLVRRLKKVVQGLRSLISRYFRVLQI